MKYRTTLGLRNLSNLAACAGCHPNLRILPERSGYVTHVVLANGSACAVCMRSALYKNVGVPQLALRIHNFGLFNLPGCILLDSPHSFL
jgi:hypothetical protein